MEIAIKYEDVGRRKFSETLTYQVPDELQADDVAALAYLEARKHLVSVGIEVVYDSDANEGKIFAGFHTAGSFKLTKGQVTVDKMLVKRQGS